MRRMAAEMHDSGHFWANTPNVHSFFSDELDGEIQIASIELEWDTACWEIRLFISAAFHPSRALPVKQSAQKYRQEGGDETFAIKLSTVRRAPCATIWCIASTSSHLPVWRDHAFSYMFLFFLPKGLHVQPGCHAVKVKLELIVFLS